MWSRRTNFPSLASSFVGSTVCLERGKRRTTMIENWSNAIWVWSRSREGENRIRAVRGRSCPCWQLPRLARRVRIIVIYCLAASRLAAPLFSNQPTRIDKLCESQDTARGSTIRYPLSTIHYPRDPSSSNPFVQHRERLSPLFLLLFPPFSFCIYMLLRLASNERLTNVNTNLRTRKYTVLIAYSGTRAQRVILFA